MATELLGSFRGTQTCIHYNGTAVEASYWSWPNGNNALMTSPIFDVSSMISPELIFDWSHTYNTFYPNDALEVLVSDDGGTTWNQIWYKIGSDLESNDGATTQSQVALFRPAELTYQPMEITSWLDLILHLAMAQIVLLTMSKF